MYPRVAICTLGAVVCTLGVAVCILETTILILVHICTVLHMYVRILCCTFDPPVVLRLTLSQQELAERSSALDEAIQVQTYTYMHRAVSSSKLP